MELNQLGSNQTEIRTDKYIVLFSYNTAVAYWKDGVYYKTNKKHSVTTSKHINKWLGATPVTEVPQGELDILLDGEVKS